MAWRNNPAFQHSVAGYRRDQFAPYDAHHNNLQTWVLICIDGDFQATDKRDYIYAVLGISANFQNGDIVPDYNKSLVDVFLIAAREMGDHESLALAKMIGLRMDLRDVEERKRKDRFLQGCE